MKKEYMQPTIEIIELVDIVTASGQLGKQPWDPNQFDDDNDPFPL